MKMMKTNFDFNTLVSVNRIVHEPSRAAVLILLSVVEEADFTFIMNSTGLTQGNLSSHLSKLEEAGMIEIRKGFRGKRPNTSLSITSSGREELSLYIKTMKSLFNNLQL